MSFLRGDCKTPKSETCGEGMSDSMPGLEWKQVFLHSAFGVETAKIPTQHSQTFTFLYQQSQVSFFFSRFSVATNGVPTLSSTSFFDLFPSFPALISGKPPKLLVRPLELHAVSPWTRKSMRRTWRTPWPWNPAGSQRRGR